MDPPDAESLGAFTESVGIQLKNRACRLTVSGNVSAEERERGSRLNVKLECSHTPEVWQATFTPAVLEDITKKTGNFKRFSVFVEMLLSSLRKSSQIVQLDFLTSDDLESLKSTQRPRPEPVSQPSDRDKSWKKVYMILTYAVAFDRVHYPLPLLSEGQGVQGGQGGQGWILRDPEKDALAEENAELRTEKSKQLKEISALLRENDKLKYKLKHTKTPNHEARNATSSGPVKHAQRDLAKELNALRIGTQRFLKDIQHELSSFCRKHPAIQNSPHIFRIEDYLSRLEALIWLFLDDAQPGETRQTRDKTHRTQSGSRSRINQRDRHLQTTEQSPAPIHRRPSSTRKGHNTANSGYKIVKSRPLLESPPPPPRRAVPRSISSRDSSASSFRRFDPTQYIQERNRKMDERRARSRDRSLASQRSVPRSLHSSSTATSVDRWRAPAVPSRAARPPARKEKVDAHTSQSRNNRKGNGTGSKPRKAAKARKKERRSSKSSEIDWETGTNVDTVEIDRRLAKLYDSIINVR